MVDHEGTPPASDSSTPPAAEPVALDVPENAEPLAPLTPAETKGKPVRSRTHKKSKGKRGRPPKYGSPEEARTARNEREKDKREREAAQKAAEAAAGIASPSTNTPPAALTEDGTPALVAAEPVDLQPLANMIGLAADMGARFLPEPIGGELTAAERDTLGTVWAPVLAEYMGGAGAMSPFMLASVTTVQVFALRAFANMEQKKAEAAAPPADKQAPQDKSAPSTAPAATPKANARPAAPATAAPARKKTRLPLYTGAD